MRIIRYILAALLLIAAISNSIPVANEVISGNGLSPAGYEDACGVTIALAFICLLLFWRNKRTFFGGLLLILCTFPVMAVFDGPTPTDGRELSPLMVAAFFGISGVALLILGLRAKKRQPTATPTTKVGRRSFSSRLGIFFGALVGKTCGRCHEPVSILATAGQRCPHCGVYWDYEREIYK